MGKKLSVKELLYLKWLRESNTENLTWRQFYTELYGECHWMQSKFYNGEWLDKIMGDLEFNQTKLLANVIINPKNKNLLEHLKPFKEIELSGIKYGIIGLTTNEIFYTWRFDGGKITSPKKALEQYEDVLKKRKNDVLS